jgi:2-keto-4-pentenoate hydratase
MNAAAIEKAASLLVHARRNREPLTRLPEDCRPTTLAQAFAIEAATVRQLDDDVAGWKLALLPDGQFSYGVILASVVRRSGDVVDARDVPLLGMEGEIAFRFVQDAPARDTPYSFDEVAERVVAFPLIEIVASRYADYHATPVVERAADMMSNGAFVVGDDQPAWRAMDLVNVPVSLAFDDVVVVERNGGHALGDPLPLAVDMVNRLRESTGLRAGQMITTGTYTGMKVAKRGQRVSVRFGGFPVCTVATT